MSSEHLEETWRLRNNMTGDSLEYTEQFIRFLKKTKNNEEFLAAFHDVSFSGKKTRRSGK